jgi:hypothetical protein
MGSADPLCCSWFRFASRRFAWPFPARITMQAPSQWTCLPMVEESR